VAWGHAPQATFQREEDLVRISVQRSGGFAGTTENIVELDTRHLDQATAQHVRQLVRGLGSPDQPEVAPPPSMGADFFHYEITVNRGSRRRTIAFDDDDSPASAVMRGTIEALKQI
jgi:hypothetical protein